MASFSAIPPFVGSADVTLRPAQGTARDAVAPVEPTDRARAPHARRPGDTGAGDDRPTGTPMPPQDNRAPTGPPPAFAANLLELERNLTELIARLEAARSLGWTSQDQTRPWTR